MKIVINKFTKIFDLDFLIYAVIEDVPKADIDIEDNAQFLNSSKLEPDIRCFLR